MHSSAQYSSIDPRSLQLFHVADRCSLFTRSLRANLLNVHKEIAVGLSEGVPSVENLRSKLDRFAKALTEEYDLRRLEAEVEALPQQMPASIMTNRLSSFLLDVSTNTIQQATHTTSRDAFQWSDSTAHGINFAMELSKTAGTFNRSRRLCFSQLLPERLPPPMVQRSVPPENPQRRFEEVFKQYMQHGQAQENPKFRYLYKYLERGPRSCVLEQPDRGTCLLKFLLLVNNGGFEYIQFIAPHEDWTYLDAALGGQVDLAIESRYELYRRLSSQGNSVINMIGASQPVLGDQGRFLHFFFSMVGKFHHLDVACQQCKKILKDFIPTTVSDPKKIAYHQSCRS